MKFSPYPFTHLNNLIKEIDKKNFINLSIGEPKFTTPKAICDEIIEKIDTISMYPKSNPLEDLKLVQLKYIKNTFNISLKTSNIIPTFGTREALFSIPQFLCNIYTDASSNKDLAIAPNPFYKVYEGANINAKIKTKFINIEDFASIDDDLLRRTRFIIVNSPHNPTGKILSLETLKNLIQKSKEFGFFIISDECYIGIYSDKRAPSILEADKELKNDLKNIIALNSASKIISAAGLRSGYVVGEEKFIKAYQEYRSYDISIPMPLQYGAIKAWSLTKEMEEIRQKYARNLKIAMEIFSTTSDISPYTFYLWLNVKNTKKYKNTISDSLSIGEIACKELYKELGILVLPGKYLSANNCNAYDDFVRIALVYENDVIKEQLERIKLFLDD